MRERLVVFFLFVAGFMNAQENTDWRFIKNAESEIPSENYCDQPYVVIAHNGNWVTVLTTGPGTESQEGQHMVAAISSDKGKSWSKLIDIESTNSPASSWGIPYITPDGRIYVFYSFNGDNITDMKGKKIIYNSELGWYCFKYSDDNGETWSNRYRIPIRKTIVDYINPWDGEVQLFWGISKPFEHGGAMYFAYTKMAIYSQDMGEGFLFKSTNINTEKNPDKINWELLPEGDQGISTTILGVTQEEHNVVPLNSGGLYCMFRTDEGYPADSYSSNNGKTWTTPQFATYADGRVMKNPRACPRVFKTSNGKYLFWYHNNNQKGYQGLRNPAWISGGIEQNGKIYWSEPEVLLYAPAGERMSYPDLVEENGNFWITETQKEIARIHKIDTQLLEGLWRQFDDKNLTTEGIAISKTDIKQNDEIKSITLPDLSTKGFTVELWLETKTLEPNDIILDNRKENGEGLSISVSPKRTLQITIQDKSAIAEWSTDPGSVKENSLNHVVFIVDGAADLISIIVNGKLCDGGRYRDLGWTRFDEAIRDVSGTKNIKIIPNFNGNVEVLRIYDRYLTTSQAIRNFKYGKAE
jgi:hypothetical protein